MRILFLSNYYPPEYVGGYELRCKDIADFLQEKGHSAFILSGRSNKPCFFSEKNVYRALYWTDLKEISRADILNNIINEWRNIRSLKTLIRKIHPDLVFVWNLSGIGKSLLLALESLKLPIAYYIEDDWIYRGIKDDFWVNFCNLHYQQGNFLRRWIIGALNRMVPYRFTSWQPRYVRFVSDFIKQKAIENGFNIPEAKVLYPGIPIPEICDGFKKAPNDGAIRLLYAGQINRLKGIFTLLEAYRKFRNSYTGESILTLVGNVDDRDKVRFENETQDPRIKNAIRYLGKLTRQAVREICHQNDILIFSSEREEGMPLILSEAMSCQMAIISTASGGAAEMIIDGYNAVLFGAGNAQDLCDKMRLLADDEKLRSQLAHNAFHYAEKYFDLRRMGQEIEDFLNMIHRRS